MRVLYHPDFPKDVLRYAAQYEGISPRLGARFRVAVDEALARNQGGSDGCGTFFAHRLRDYH